MKKHWLAIFGEKEIIAAKVAEANTGDMKILFLAKYKEPGGNNITYRESENSHCDAVKNWFRYQQIPLKKLKIAVSCKGLVMTVIALPQMADNDLKRMMAGDMDRFFEPNGNNYVIDYRILKKYEENGIPMMKVLLAAFPRDRMMDILTFCSKLGLEHVEVDLTADCLARIYAYLLKKGNDPVCTDLITEEENHKLKQSPIDIAVVALNPGLVEFVLLEKSDFFLYSDMGLDLNNSVSNQILSIAPNAMSESEANTPDESFGSIDLPMLAFYKDEPAKKIGATLSWEEMEAAEAYYTQIESTKSAKDFVLEDLFVPYDQLDQEQAEKTIEQNSNTKANIHLDSVTVESNHDTLNNDEKPEPDNNQVRALIDFDPVISSLSQLIHFYTDRHDGMSVGKVYLTGEYSLWPGLTEQFKRTLGIDVVTGFPGNWKPQFKDRKGSAEEWQKYAGIFGLALGTAENQFNFAERRKADVEAEEPIQKHRRVHPVILAIIIVLAAVILASPWLWQIKQDYDQKNIEAGIASYKEVSDVLLTNSKLSMQISDQIHFLDLGNEGSIRNPEVIRSEIDKLMPKEAQVNTFTLKADDTVILGLVIPNTVSVSRLKSLFEGSDRFQSFDIQTVSLDENRQEIKVTLQMKQ